MRQTLRAARLTDRRFTQTGLAAADVDALMPDLLTYARHPRSADEMQVWLAGRLNMPVKWVWWALRHVAPLVHAPTGGPWSFAQPRRYAAAGRSPNAGPHDAANDALAVLVRRYLRGFGPATVADIAQFGRLSSASIRTALAGMAGEVEQMTGPDGVELFDLPGVPRPSADVPAPARLLPMWDNVLLAYTDRSRVIPAEYRALVIRRNGDVLSTVLIDGYVAGVWRPVRDAIEIAVFRKLSREQWDAVAGEAHRLNELLAKRDPQVYRRQDHWWDGPLPHAQLRTL